MKKQVILINGSGGVGKDTFVNFCCDYVDAINISSVDRIKEAAKILGWNGGKTESDRKFLSDMKLLTTEYNNGPFKYISDSIIRFRAEEGANILFIHIREPLEIEKVKKEFGCITLLVTNSNVPNITSNMADANVSSYEYDYVIDNSGTLYDLKHKAMKFAFKLMKGVNKNENYKS